MSGDKQDGLTFRDVSLNKIVKNLSAHTTFCLKCQDGRDCSKKDHLLARMNNQKRIMRETYGQNGSVGIWM